MPVKPAYQNMTEDAEKGKTKLMASKSSQKPPIDPLHFYALFITSRDLIQTQETDKAVRCYQKKSSPQKCSGLSALRQSCRIGEVVITTWLHSWMAKSSELVVDLVNRSWITARSIPYYYLQATFAWLIMENVYHKVSHAGPGRTLSQSR